MEPDRKLLNILTLQYHSFPDALGGAWRYSYEVAKHLARRGHTVHLVTCKPEESLADEEVIEDIRFHRIPARDSKNPLKLWRALRKTLRAVQSEAPIDLIHGHNPLVSFLADGQPELWGIPRVYHFHSLWLDEERIGIEAPGKVSGPGPLRRALIWLIEMHCFFWCRSVMFLSDYSKERFRQFYSLTEKRRSVVGGGVDTDQFRPLEPDQTKASLRKTRHLDPNAVLFLTVRRLETRMGLENLVQAVGLLKQRLPEKNFQLWIVGQGSLQETLQQRIRELKLQDRIKMVGRVSEETLTLYYQMVDAFVLPTLAIEGFGLATAEALASGLPAFGTPVGATPELLKPIDERLLFNDATPEAMAHRLAEFLEQPETFSSLDTRCRQATVEKYEWSSVVDRIEQEFYECVKK